MIDTSTARTMTAKYKSKCPCCGGNIKPGAQIAYQAGVAACVSCHARATETDRAVPSYVDDAAAYVAESAEYATRWTAAVADKAVA